ncbi:MAG: hypothetical protein R3B96_22065 [Pirellulaceae bacterium]
MTSLLLLVVLGPLRAQEPADTNYESLVPAYELPDPLVTFDGQGITDSRDLVGRAARDLERVRRTRSTESRRDSP